MKDTMKLQFPAKSSCESFARVTVAAFVSRIDPTLAEINEIKTAVSEGVTNSIIHGYENEEGIIYIECEIKGRAVKIIIADKGKGIEDIEQAMTPLFTTNPDGERSGMGFTVMETFMDKVEVKSLPGVGTRIIMTKTLDAAEEDAKCG
ncbi:MAG: anti-sigma F factor [Clostridia bacterium]|nr:anti-sigma F factor [Clostridia bacterium]